MVISDPKTGKAYNLELDEVKAKVLMGLEIGSVIDASPLGLSGYKLEITGGSDKDGFPMRRDLKGAVRRRLLLSRGPGYRPREKGLRRRKRVRGRTVIPDIVQVNVKIVERGKKSLEELLGKGAD